MIDFSKYGFVNYKPLREDWNVYELRDGTIILLKFVLIKLKLAEEDEEPVNIDLNSQNIVGILTRQDLCGEPGTRKYGRKELEKSVVEEDIDFKPIEESWNEYKLEDGRKLFFKLVLTMASRTDKFDNRGEPIYLTQSQLLTKIK